MIEITPDKKYTIRTGWNLDDFEYEIVITEEEAIELRDRLMELLVDTNK